MSRTKGTFSLTSNIEPKFGAPLDARTVVKLKTDLTANGTFDYPYIGLTVFVEEENKKYTLVGSDPTVSTNWIEDNSGGHIIKNPASTAMTQRSNLQFVDLTVSDDSTNDATKVENIHVIQSESELDNLPDGLYMLDDDEDTVIDSDLVGYDNTDSGLEATNVKDAIDELAQGGGGGGTVTDVKVNNVSVVDQHGAANIDLTGYAEKTDLGTASALDVAASGDASTSQVVKGDDTRLTNARPASDVSSWAKASTKPEYTASEVGAIATTAKGTSNGVAELDENGKVPSAQLPSYVDDVLEYSSISAFPATGESGKIYVALDTNKTYRWSGTGYTEISESLALGETSSTAYRGDRGKTAYDHSQVTSGNPHNVTKSDVGLGNVNNTSDKNKPLSDATKEALLMKLGVEALTNYYETSMIVERPYEAGKIVYVEQEGRLYRTTTSINIGDTLVPDTNCVHVDIEYLLLEKLGVDNLTTVVELVDRASSAHSMYSRFYIAYLNKWAKATANIAINDMLVMGTNYEIVTIEDVFGSIESVLSQMSTSISNKVNKETGKGLSTNDFTNEDKALIGQTLGNNTILSTDKTPFLTRQTLNPTGFSGYVREKLIGASYVWNNRFNNGNFPSASAYGWSASNATITAGVGSIKFTASGWNGYIVNNHVDFATADTFGTSGHVLLITCMVKTASATVGVQFACWSSPASSGTISANTVASTSWQMLALFIKTPSSGATSCNIALTDTRSSGWDAIEAKDFQIHDLTLAFGSTIADYLYGLSNNGGITKLRDMGCPIDKYTSYGNYLVSSKTSGKRVLSANLITGFYNGSRNGNGTTYSNATRISSENFMSLTPAKYKIIAKSYISGKTLRIAYHFWANTTVGQNSQTYDSGWINLSETTELEITSNVIMDGTFSFSDNSNISPSDVDIKIVASDVTYSLGNDELRGKFDLVNSEIVASGDVKESNGGITRVRKRVNLGDYTWIYSVENVIFYTKMVDAKNSPNNCICAKYTDHGPITAFSQLSDKEVSVSSGLSTDPLIVIKDTAYNDATTFKTAMDGVYLEYELATPTTEQSTPFADPMSLVGATTEEYIDTRDIPCPVGAERQYMGQSEDVVEIPSSPQSDGKRVLTSYVSGGKEQLVWDMLPNMKVLYSKTDWTNTHTFPRQYYPFIGIGVTSEGSLCVISNYANGNVSLYKLYGNNTITRTYSEDDKSVIFTLSDPKGLVIFGCI